MARGQGGDRFHQREWRGTARSGRSAGALPRRRLLERERNRRGGVRMGMGEKKLPLPRYNPHPRLSAVVPRWRAVVPLGAVVPLASGGSTASNQKKLLGKQKNANTPRRTGRQRQEKDQQDNTHETMNRNPLLQSKQQQKERAQASLKRGRWPEPPKIGRAHV